MNEQLIPRLQQIQQEYGYLQPEAMDRLCEETGIDRAQLISVSSFYSQFRTVPYGKHTIKVCVGTACHVKGADRVFDAFRRELQLEGDAITTADRRYTIERVACLGCCALAPVVQIDDRIFGHVQPGRVGEVLAEFEAMEAQDEQNEAEDRRTTQGEVRIGMENCCQASGTAEVKAAVVDACRSLGIQVSVKPISCIGACNQVPLIDVATTDGHIVRYPNVKPDEVKEILLHHFRPSSRWRRWRNAIVNQIDTFHTDQTWDNILFTPEPQRTQTINTFLEGQFRISTEGFGHLNPLDIEEYIALGGFDALTKALTTMSRQQVIDEVLHSGLRGRGGGGFPTGKKWQAVFDASSPSSPSSVSVSAVHGRPHPSSPHSVPVAAVHGRPSPPILVCNGDEGDPGAFMDRILLESYPLRVIEGMIIAAYAVGAAEGIFYIRAEYPQAVIRIGKALDMCRERGMLGDRILGTDFSFDIRVFEGAGAFVCGEETALIASMEGKRGFPHLRPPYPSQKGFHDRPTLINNVETLSQVPYIIRHGAAEYTKVGTAGSPGTKVFALAGRVRRGGLIEVPMGTTLRQIVEQIGGGVEDGEALKAVQTGGPSGGCIPAELCDAEVDFDGLNQMGAIMGSGGLVVLGESSCMVDVARYFLRFTCAESCGKCTFCRIGIRRMLDILDRLTTGQAKMEDIDRLEQLALAVKRASLCGLGKTAPNPVLSTLRYFRHEYEEHVRGICRTGSCKQMVKFEITDDCVGCTKCSRSCPSDAIAYTPYERHVIDTARCTQCGLCIDQCDFKAIIKVPSHHTH